MVFRLFIRFFVSLFIAVFLTACALSVWQAGREEKRLKSEIERRSFDLTEDISQKVRPFLAKGDMQGAEDLIHSVPLTDDFLRVELYDPQGMRLAVSEHENTDLPKVPATIQNTTKDLIREDSWTSRFFSESKNFLHVCAMPVASESGTYVLCLYQNASSVSEEVRKIWMQHFLRLLIQTSVLLVITPLVIYLNVKRPMNRIAEWTKQIRMGQNPDSLPKKHGKIFEPLADEITKMARSLEVARFSAEEEARLRLSMEPVWTAERLKAFARRRLKERPFFVVSNREPYTHIRKGKDIQCQVPASGLVTALEPVLKACGGIWIAQATGDADKETADPQGRIMVPPDEPQYVLKRVWIDKETEMGYYFGFSNEGLWPLCHVAHTRPIFRESDWENYMKANRIFADALLEEMEGTEEPFVWVQDYHFALLPKMIKAKRPDARVAIFWHIPWTNPESFGICPWQRELLEGMLGADIIGFHTQYHCNNFMETVDRVLEARLDYERFTVNREGQTTLVKPFPISIAFNGGDENKASNSPAIDAILKNYGIQTEYIGVGVDRLDYTKGILERFRGVEMFLDKNPEYVGKFTFVELGAPTRTLIPRYQDFMVELLRECDRINARWKIKNWKPILFLEKHHSHEEIFPFYKAAKLCLVTSLHDGMNLVAKEFVSSRNDEQGVLILSQFTGAARELADSLVINPYDIGQTADSIRRAIEMPADEQRARMKRMRRTLREWNVYRWAADVIHDMTEIRPGAFV